jgi:hypothetical protein
MCSVKFEFEFEFLLFGASFSCGKHTITFEHIYENKKIKNKNLKLSSSFGKSDAALRLMI